MSNINIITLDPERWQEYRALRLRALQQAPQAFGTSFEEDEPKPEQHWRDRLETSQQGQGSFLFFAEADAELVGLVGIFRLDRIKLAHIANLYSMYVDESVRGHGVGRQLVDAALTEVRKYPDIVKVMLSVNTEQPAAIALYKRAGFEIVGTTRKEYKIGDRFYDGNFMEKLL